MKNLKLLILGMLVCVLCTTQTLGQAPSVACGVAAYDHGTSSLALVAHEGDVLDYVVDVTNGPFPIENGVVTLTLPDGTVVTLDTTLSLAALGTIQYPVTFPPVPASQQYTIDSGHIGNNSAPANSVQALSSCVADAIIDPQTTVEVTGTGQWPTLVITPCVDVEKTVEPDVSKIGDDVLYTLEVCNCGDTDLTLVSFDDTVLGDLSGSYPSSLPAGGDCVTHSFFYTIQPDDPDPLENVVEVVYEDETGFDVTDTDFALVDLVEVCIDIDKTVDPTVASVGEEVLYTICIHNCG